MTSIASADNCSRMFLGALQRLVRMAPGPARWAWSAVPARMKARLTPYIHPIAAGKRGGSLVLAVPEEAAPRRYDVLGTPGALPSVLANELRARGHRVFSSELDGDVGVIIERERVVDGVLVSRASDTTVTSGIGFGLRRFAGDLEAPEVLDRLFPTVTIVVVTWQNRDLCRACLDGIRRNTPFPGLRVIVVDNGSSDGTGAMLAARAARDGDLTVVTNTENRGFARGANQGLRLAQSELVVLLNDDTVPAPGWLSRLVAHLEADRTLGLVCPVTNEIGNDARVDIDYRTLEGMEAFAAMRARTLSGQRHETNVIALFCAAGWRSVLESVGFVDERYAIGMFEDDDLSLALGRRGLRLAVAHDAFVHHVGQASFARLSDAEYLAIWTANRARFEEKWGVRYAPPTPGGS